MDKDLTQLTEYINEKIKPYTISEHGKTQLSVLLAKYPLVLLKECVDISFSKYLEFSNGQMLESSIGVALGKIGGIAYNKCLSPIEREIARICYQGKSEYSYWNEKKAKSILHTYVKALGNHWDDEQIIEDLQKEVTDLFADKSNWTAWYSQIEKWIEDIRGWGKNNNPTTELEENILPAELFFNTPTYVNSLQKQVNLSYSNELYDCTAIMMRRLIEVLLILSYKKNKLETEIKDGEYYFNLDKIIKKLEANNVLGVSIHTIKDIKNIKELGNLSAHRILFNATKSDIDGIKLKFRTAIEELLYKI